MASRAVDMPTGEVIRMAKNLVDIPEDKLAATQAILGTNSKRATVERALDLVLQQAQQRELIEAVAAGGVSAHFGPVSSPASVPEAVLDNSAYARIRTSREVREALLDHLAQPLGTLCSVLVQRLEIGVSARQLLEFDREDGRARGCSTARADDRGRRAGAVAPACAGRTGRAPWS